MGAKKGPSRALLVIRNDGFQDARDLAEFGPIWARTRDPGHTLHSRAHHQDDVSRTGNSLKLVVVVVVVVDVVV